MKLIYTVNAIADIDAAIAWYEKQYKGLGLEFLGSVELAAGQICETPCLYPLKHKGLRVALLRRFPFTLFYEVQEEQIVVHAVFDNRQDPQRLP